MAWEVPHRLAGALSLAITPNRAIGPYEENPNTAPRVRIHSCQNELRSETGSVHLTAVNQQLLTNLRSHAQYEGVLTFLG